MVIPQGFKTPAVAELVGTSYSQLVNLIRGKKIPPPAKDTSGDYLWTQADIERARQALAARRRTPAAASVGGGDAA